MRVKGLLAESASTRIERLRFPAVVKDHQAKKIPPPTNLIDSKSHVLFVSVTISI